MKIKFKSTIVISLLVTILFSMLPTISFGAQYSEQEAADLYIHTLENCAKATSDKSTEDEKQEVQFEYLKKMLDIWYDTGDNASKLSVEEKTTTNVQEDGNEQTKITYILNDDTGIEEGTIKRIFETQIIPTIGDRQMVVNLYGKEDEIPAVTYLGGVLGYGTNQIFGRNEEELSNHIVSKIKPDVQVDTDYNSLSETLNKGTVERIGMVLTGIAKVIYQPLKWIVFLLPGGIIQLVIEGIASLDGGEQGIATLDRILFNKIGIANANIFESNVGQNLGQIRQNIGAWYSAFRNLSIVISLCMLIYIGIRMAISSIAEKKAEYKEMLKNWFMGMLILFLLHYFMVILLNVNDALVEAVGSAIILDDSYTNLLGQLLQNSLKINVIKSTTAAICFLMLQGLTFGYLIMYIKRMLTISLLTCVAPLITTTYAMDKVGDKKSQVLNTWIKEYSYNVLMQPFHCIIYIVFVKNALDILVETPTSFAAAIIAVMCMSFMIISEGIVKAIFGLQGNTMTSAASSVAAFAAGATTMANLTGKVKNARQKIESNVKTTGDMAKKMPKVENKLDKDAKIGEKVKSAGEKAMQGAGKAAGVAKKLYLNPKLTGIQTAMVSGALGLATGDAGTALHSARGGKAAGETLGAHMSEMDKRRQVSRNERMFERQFDEYQLANPNANMRDLTAKILAGEKVPEGMEHYAASAIGLKDTYKLDGKEDPIKAVLDNIDDLKKYETR